MFIRAEAATRSLGASSAGSGTLCSVPIQYLHTHSKTQPLIPGPESTTTYFGGLGAKRFGMRPPVWPASQLMFSLYISQGEAGLNQCS